MLFYAASACMHIEPFQVSPQTRLSPLCEYFQFAYKERKVHARGREPGLRISQVHNHCTKDELNKVAGQEIQDYIARKV